MRGDALGGRGSPPPAEISQMNFGSAAKPFGINALDVAVANQQHACHGHLPEKPNRRKTATALAKHRGSKQHKIVQLIRRVGPSPTAFRYVLYVNVQGLCYFLVNVVDSRNEDGMPPRTA